MKHAQTIINLLLLFCIFALCFSSYQQINRINELENRLETIHHNYRMTEDGSIVTKDYYENN